MSTVLTDRMPLRRLVQFLLLALALWSTIYARTALGPLQETITRALGLSDHEIAILQGTAGAIAVIAGAVPLGLLIDRYSRAKLLFCFVSMALAASILTASTSNFMLLCLARAVVALAMIGTLIGVFSMVADLSSPTQRGRATIVVAGSELGGPAAFAIGGLLLAAYGHHPDGWRWTLLWMTGPTLAAVLFCLLWLREPERKGTVVKAPPLKTAFTELWHYRAMIVPLLSARCLVGVADGATNIWAAPLLARRFDLPPDRIGAIMAAGGLISSVIATLVGSFLADACQRAGGPRRTMRAMAVLALVSVPAGLFGIAPDYISTSILLFIFITLGFSANVAGGALSTIVVPNEIRGTFISVTMVAGAILGVGLAPLLVSTLSAALGGPLMIGRALVVVCVVASILGAVVFAIGSRAFPGQGNADDTAAR